MNQELKNKIQEAAFQMFRDWTNNAKSIYSEYDFTIIDETILVNDLTTCIHVAVDSLKKEERKSKRKKAGYDVGFIWGFIHANLNGRWVHEYIRKRSNDYKMLMTLKALQLYLDIEEIALIQIDEFYKKMLIEDVNFENIYFKPDKQQFKDFGSDIKMNLENHRQNNISISLDNLITEKIVKIISEKDKQFLPEVEKYLSEDDVDILIAEF